MAERRWPWKGMQTLPDRKPDEELWQWVRRCARDVLNRPVPEEADLREGPPRPRQERPYLERLEEIYRTEERVPGEEG